METPSPPASSSRARTRARQANLQAAATAGSCHYRSPPDCSVLDLKSRFEIYGAISRIRIDRDAVGYVTYRATDSAEAAIAASLDPSFGITLDSKKVLWATDPLAQWRKGVGVGAENRDSSNGSSSNSNLLRAEVPLRRHGRGNKLASAIVNPRVAAADGSSALDVPAKAREIVAYDDILENSKARRRRRRRREQEIWSWGAGTDGQLGTGRLQDELLPQLLHLTSLSSAGPISFLACGGAHVLALTSDTGALFTCGDGTFGQLGHGDYRLHCYPVEVSFFASKHVEQIACGMRHSLVLLRGGSGDEVYGFGSGKRGQLGIAKDKINLVSLPERSCGFEGVKIASITANGDHSAALSADGHLYTWGRGFGDTLSAKTPQRLPTSFCFTKIALGWNHALVLTGGEVFMFGGNHHGVLSNPDKMTPVKHSADSRAVVLEKVPGLEGSRTLHIAAGAEHSAIVTENGVLKTWGWGEHGQLGLGNISDQTSPQEVSLSHKFWKEAGLIEIYCGSGFTIAIRTLCRPSQAG
ncbi:Regulator of chromosome condensation family protein [Prunus dulcis]|uniref:Regulator of chromosome condensation family protein n=1 Tax=Prunus dulcis TaxID=3755 RepID=A0A4Y1QQS6_PRUDU|nr:Regulator of chromosome condensation family protein [Prunus dulcis]